MKRGNSYFPSTLKEESVLPFRLLAKFICAFKVILLFSIVFNYGELSYPPSALKT